METQFLQNLSDPTKKNYPSPDASQDCMSFNRIVRADVSRQSSEFYTENFHGRDYHIVIPTGLR